MNQPAFLHLRATVREQIPLARDTYKLSLHIPALAARIQAGQFIMFRLPGRNDPLLGRAFALYDVGLSPAGAPEIVEIAYLVVGKMTGLMTALQPGADVEVWGPLGNGFPSYAGVEHLVLVAGGIGQTPFPALTKRVLGKAGYGGADRAAEVSRVTLYYGVRTRDLVAGLEDFEAAGAEVRLASNDGTCGYQGFVTELLEQDLRTGKLDQRIRLAGCGPEPMLHALAVLAERHSLACDLSLETPMACGVGICFSCVARIKTESGWDYRRVCVEGPVFDASTLAW